MNKFFKPYHFIKENFNLIVNPLTSTELDPYTTYQNEDDSTDDVPYIVSHPFQFLFLVIVYSLLAIYTFTLILQNAWRLPIIIILVCIALNGIPILGSIAAIFIIKSYDGRIDKVAIDALLNTFNIQERGKSFL